MRRLLLLAGLVALVGCTAPLRPEGVRHVSNDHVLKSNYVIGQPLTVNVGDPMVKVQDYWEDSYEEPAATPTKTSTMRGGAVDIAFQEGQSYPIKGRIAVSGKDYQVVARDQSRAYQAALLGDDGKLYQQIVAKVPDGDNHVMVVYTLKVDPPDATFVRQATKKVNSSKGFVNYEVLYTGISDNSINLTYREFSPEGLARVAFFQNLTYPRNASTITFRNLRLAVDQATPESITIRVLSDGRSAG